MRSRANELKHYIRTQQRQIKTLVPNEKTLLRLMIEELEHEQGIVTTIGKHGGVTFAAKETVK